MDVDKGPAVGIQLIEHGPELADGHEVVAESPTEGIVGKGQRRVDDERVEEQMLHRAGPGHERDRRRGRRRDNEDRRCHRTRDRGSARPAKRGMRPTLTGQGSIARRNEHHDDAEDQRERRDPARSGAHRPRPGPESGRGSGEVAGRPRPGVASCHTMKEPGLGPVAPFAHVDSAALVPDGDVADTPPIATVEMGPVGVLEEEVQEGVALTRGHADDRPGEALVDEQQLAAGVWMHGDDRWVLPGNRCDDHTALVLAIPRAQSGR